MTTVTPDAPAPAEARRRGPARWIALGVLVVVAAFIVVLATRPAADTKTPANPLVGEPAPDISGTSLDGRSVSLASLRGRWVVVNFFATWCVPCRNEHPDLLRFSQDNQGANSPTILAVAYDENDLDAAKSFFLQKGGTWPVVPDHGGHIAVSYGVRGLPESYVVDPNGNVSQHITGQVTYDQLEQMTGGVA
jgi:cytochrome c biogenesis protein CcmG, thiol:disulfide interchange protein DsbE